MHLKRCLLYIVQHFQVICRMGVGSYVSSMLPRMEVCRWSWRCRRGNLTCFTNEGSRFLSELGMRSSAIVMGEESVWGLPVTIEICNNYGEWKCLRTSNCRDWSAVIGTSTMLINKVLFPKLKMTVRNIDNYIKRSIIFNRSPLSSLISK